MQNGVSKTAAAETEVIKTHISHWRYYERLQPWGAWY